MLPRADSAASIHKPPFPHCGSAVGGSALEIELKLIFAIFEIQFVTMNAKADGESFVTILQGINPILADSFRKGGAEPNL